MRYPLGLIRVGKVGVANRDIRDSEAKFALGRPLFLLSRSHFHLTCLHPSIKLMLGTLNAVEAEEETVSLSG